MVLISLSYRMYGNHMAVGLGWRIAASARLLWRGIIQAKYNWIEVHQQAILLAFYQSDDHLVGSRLLFLPNGDPENWVRGTTIGPSCSDCPHAMLLDIRKAITLGVLITLFRVMSDFNEHQE